MSQSSTLLFDGKGWKIPKSFHRTFSDNPKWFYKLGDFSNDEGVILNSLVKYSDLKRPEDAKKALVELSNNINSDNKIKNLNKGPRVAFALNKLVINDIGEYIESILLKVLAKSFHDCHPEHHFKAVIQDKTFLKGKLSPTPNTGYSEFIEALRSSNICGYYYPQALQEYSIDSQIEQMEDFKGNNNMCLSGPLEIGNALIASPNLIINEDHYSPILCLSGVKHIDPRLICCFKSYGLHLEFWCLSQMLTKTDKQLSEQWAGGLTLFTSY